MEMWRKGVMQSSNAGQPSPPNQIKSKGKREGLSYFEKKINAHETGTKNIMCVTVTWKIEYNISGTMKAVINSVKLVQI